MPFYVWNLYNHVIAFFKEPGRVLTDVSAAMALVIYSIPSVFHIALCLGIGALIHHGLKRLKRHESPNKSSELPAKRRRLKAVVGLQD